MRDDPLFPRRQPCPCGSGEKFKNCCEPIAPSVDAQVIDRVERQNHGTLAGMIAGLDDEIARRKTS
jgi:hypothetical protein